MERRLAAVLIADVVGYVRLSQADEEGTRARFQADQREVFEPAIAAHHGRLVKTMGDALLVEFHSVVDAARCAVEVQRLKSERNAGAPTAGRLVYRIGINLGDVIVEGEDIHGDGVNIADRLQELADPGGIAISGTAYDHFGSKVEVGYAYLGEQRVKHVAEPVRIYRVLMDPAAAGKTIGESSARGWSWRPPAVVAAVAVVVAIAAGAAAWWRPWEPRIEPASIERMALPLPDKPSIAVLPFVNMSGDPKQEAFSDGITDDLITELSQVSGLFVISRNSTFVYKGKIVTPKQVSEELGVRYVLEGSVQRAGDQLRINAQLIDALSGGHEWAEKFDGSLADVFALQDKVTRSVADALAVKLTDAERLAIGQQETSIPAAYDAFLAGWAHYRRTTPEDYAKAIPLFEKALSLDPSYYRAYAALAMVYARSFSRHWSNSLGISDDEALTRAQRYLREAEKQPTALAQQAAGYLLLARSLFKDALPHFKEAIALDPGDSWSYAFAALALTSAGQPAEALPYIEVAMRLDPHPPPLFLYYLGLTRLGLEQFEDAASSLESAAQLNPDDQFVFAALGATYAHLGRERDATAAIARYNELEVAQGGVPLALSFCSCVIIEIQQLKAGLRLAGVPEDLRHSEFAEQNRLSAMEIRSLIIGHRLHGRSRITGVERSASLTKDGVAAMSGDWATGINPLTGGAARFNGDDLCLEFAARNYCGPVLRNPGANRMYENEYIWVLERINLSEPFQFSVME
jgi:TolB-like protein/class 3 adenylate cyclase/Tfp pilus assembly protein PilF